LNKEVNQVAANSMRAWLDKQGMVAVASAARPMISGAGLKSTIRREVSLSAHSA
jgi:hypothetical protein